MKRHKWSKWIWTDGGAAGAGVRALTVSELVLLQQSLGLMLDRPEQRLFRSTPG